MERVFEGLDDDNSDAENNYSIISKSNYLNHLNSNSHDKPGLVQDFKVEKNINLQNYELKDEEENSKLILKNH
jgi:hypothetical protein